MSKGLFYSDTLAPFSTANQAAVTLAATLKALYPAAMAPLGAQFFSIIGQRLQIRLFGQITTGATPLNLVLSLLYGSGADAAGIAICSSAAIALVASQTNIAWEAEFIVSVRALGAAGVLFGRGEAKFSPAVIASTAQPILIPASAPVVSAAVDLTSATSVLSVQASRSGSTVETIQVLDMEVVSLT